MSSIKISDLAATANFPAIAKKYIPSLSECGAGWLGICPFHEDKNPSFSLYRNPEGKWYAKCLRGCVWAGRKDFGDAADFLRAMGLEGADRIRALGGDIDLPAPGTGRRSVPPAPVAPVNPAADDFKRREKAWRRLRAAGEKSGADEMTRRYLAGRAGVDIDRLVLPSSPVFDCHDQMWLPLPAGGADEIVRGRKYARAGFREVDPESGEEIDSIRTVWLTESGEKLREIIDPKTGTPSPLFDPKIRSKKITKRPGEVRRGAVIWGKIDAAIAIIGEGAETVSVIAQRFRAQLDAGDLQIQSTGSSSLSGWAVNSAVRRVIIAADADDSGENFKQKIRKFLAADGREFAAVSPKESPALDNLSAAEVKDFDDLNRVCGGEAVEALFAPLLDLEQPLPPSSLSGTESDERIVHDELGELDYNDPIEDLAENYTRILRHIARRTGSDFVAGEEGGQLMQYDPGAKHWKPLSGAAQTKLVFALEKECITYISDSRRGHSRLNTSARKRSEAAIGDLIGLCEKPGFFETDEALIPLLNGVLRIKKCERLGRHVFELQDHGPERNNLFTLNAVFDQGLFTEAGLAARMKGSYLEKILAGFSLQGEHGHSIGLALQEVAGAVISRAAGFKRQAIFALGAADSGKSTVTALLESLLPERFRSAVGYAKWSYSLDFNEISRSSLQINADDYDKIDAGLFDKLVTGNDPIQFRFSHGNGFSKKWRGVLVNSANVPPRFSPGISRGVLRRILVLPFRNKIPEDMKILDIEQIIQDEEYDLLVAWAALGALRLLDQGAFTNHPVFDEEKAKLFVDSDPFKAWFDECIEKTENPEHMIDIDTLKASVNAYYSDLGIKNLFTSGKILSQKLGEVEMNGARKMVKGNHTTWFIGWRFRADIDAAYSDPAPQAVQSQDDPEKTIREIATSKFMIDVPGGPDRALRPQGFLLQDALKEQGQRDRLETQFSVKVRGEIVLLPLDHGAFKAAIRCTSRDWSAAVARHPDCSVLDRYVRLPLHLLEPPVELSPHDIEYDRMMAAE